MILFLQGKMWVGENQYSGIFYTVLVIFSVFPQCLVTARTWFLQKPARFHIHVLARFEIFQGNFKTGRNDNLEFAYTLKMKALALGVLKHVLKGVLKFQRKTPMVESLFYKVEACNLIKKRLHHRCFPVKFANSLRTPLFTEHLRWLILLTEK